MLTESVPVACSRVEALRCHGYTSEARRLAVAVARGIKFHQQRRLSHSRTGHYSSSMRIVHRHGQYITSPCLHTSLWKSSVDQLTAQLSTVVPHRPLHTSVRRLSMAASSIHYSAFFGGSAMPAQHTRSTGLLCGRPTTLEPSARQLERSRSWLGQLLTSAEDAFIYTVYWRI